jgi:ABC-type amino acid transport system permease subunit
MRGTILFFVISIHDLMRLMQRGGNWMFTFVTACYLCQRFLYLINHTYLVADLHAAESIFYYTLKFEATVCVNIVTCFSD